MANYNNIKVKLISSQSIQWVATVGLRTSGSVSGASGCYAGGREFNSSRTNTQGLKIIE